MAVIEVDFRKPGSGITEHFRPPSAPPPGNLPAPPTPAGPAPAIEDVPPTSRPRRRRQLDGTGRILPWHRLRPTPVLDDNGWILDLRTVLLLFHHYSHTDPYPPYAEHLRDQLKSALDRQSPGAEVSGVIDSEAFDLVELTGALIRDFEGRGW